MPVELWEQLTEPLQVVISAMKAYDSYPLRQRQLCLAHLCRDFQAMIDRGGPGQSVGAALLEHLHVLFAWWHWVRDGTWKRSTFHSYVRTLRASFKLEFA